MCDDVLLSVIHDYELREPTDRPIISVDYKGKWFEQNKFIKEGWEYYHESKQGSIVTDQEKVSKLTRALERVQIDCKKNTPQEKDGQVKTNIPDFRELTDWIQQRDQASDMGNSN